MHISLIYVYIIYDVEYRKKYILTTVLLSISQYYSVQINILTSFFAFRFSQTLRNRSLISTCRPYQIPSAQTDEYHSFVKMAFSSSKLINQYTHLNRKVNME